MTGSRVAVVTGGASGIGAAATRRLLADGWAVSVWSRNKERNEQLRKSAPAAPLVVCDTDVSSEADAAAAMARTVDELGSPVGLVCAAASVTRASTFAQRHELGSWRREVVDAVDAVAVPVWEVVRVLRTERAHGSVVIVGSLAAISGQPLGDAYAAGKGAALAFARSIACQLGRHQIRVNAVLPGWVETPMTEPILRWPAAAERIVHRIALGRLGSADEVAGTIAFLLGDDSSYVTGQALVVDGGYSVS